MSKPVDVEVTGPVVGRGAVLYPDALGPASPPEHPSAPVLARLFAARRATVLPPDPLYLRRPDVAMSYSRKSVL